MPNLYIIAGPNGSGKSTFAQEFLPKFAKCKHFLNTDLIALGLSPFDPTGVRLKAGRLLLFQINAFINDKQDFAFESTLAGKTYITLIKNAKKKGYSIHIFFLWIPDVRLAKARIKQRVKNGGHDVSEEDIDRRFIRSRRNFINNYRSLSDAWIVFDNALDKPKEVVRSNSGNLKIIDKHLYNQFEGK